MIQYLINATAIWLLSLMVFDLWLRKSTHHTYNRAYLIITALLGALAPLWHVSPKVALISPTLSKPMMAVAEVKQTIASVASVPQHTIPWTMWILGACILGIIISCSFLLREGIMLLRWYRSADKQMHGNLRLVITHRDHGPFSLFRCIFISNTEAYTPEELRFILQHESVHIRRFHFPDKVLLLAMRCIFWFHPLSWLYYSRLMMIHEYEADDTARKAPRDYVHFLIHQQLTGTTPLLAHSFFYSPLKNRIRMLTATRSRSWRKASYLLALPAIVAFAILWVNNSTAHKREKHGNMVTFKGNTFEMGFPTLGGKPANPETKIFLASTPVTSETIDVKDESEKNAGRNESAPIVKGDARMEYAAKQPMTISFTLDSIPVKMNGQRIYELKELTEAPAVSGPSKSLLSMLVNSTQEDLNKLPNGKYNLLVYETIVDPSGHLVYYTTSGLFLVDGTFALAPGMDLEAAEAAAKKEKEAHPIPESVQDRINTALEQTLDGMTFTPGKVAGNPVIARADIFHANEFIVVNNHKAKAVRIR